MNIYSGNVQLILTEKFWTKKSCVKMVPKKTALTTYCSRRRKYMQIFFNGSRGMKNGWIESSPGMKILKISVRNWAKAEEHGMELSRPSPPHESSDVRIKSQDNVDLLLWPKRNTVHREFVSRGQTNSQMFYLRILVRLKLLIFRVRPELFPDKWILPHDNASSRRTLPSRRFWRKTRPRSYNSSPAIAPCDREGSS